MYKNGNFWIIQKRNFQDVLCKDNANWSASSPISPSKTFAWINAKSFIFTITEAQKYLNHSVFKWTTSSNGLKVMLLSYRQHPVTAVFLPFNVLLISRNYQLSSFMIHYIFFSKKLSLCNIISDLVKVKYWIPRMGGGIWKSMIKIIVNNEVFPKIVFLFPWENKFIRPTAMSANALHSARTHDNHGLVFIATENRWKFQS